MTACGPYPRSAISPKIDSASWKAAERIFKLCPSISHMIVRSEQGGWHVYRDYPSAQHFEVDESLAERCRSDAALTEVEMWRHPSEPPRVATPADPFMSSWSGAAAALKASYEAGELSRRKTASRSVV